MDMNWLAFYIWLHLLLAALLLPVLIGLSRQSTQLAPSLMLRLWTFSAVLLVVLPKPSSVIAPTASRSPAALSETELPKKSIESRAKLTFLPPV